MNLFNLFDDWSKKYKKSIDCNNPKGFSQKAHCAGRRARQAGKNTKSKSVNESNLNLMDGFRGLLPIAVKHLNLPKIPKIHLNKEQSGTHQASFGGYDSGTDEIHLTISNRHPVDILRTLAHELVHYKQKLNHELNDDSWKTGSDAENEANAEAGVIMRMFNKQHPEFMGVPPIISETIRKIGPSKWRLYSKDGKKNLGTFSSLEAAKKHEREVQYFKHMEENFADGKVKGKSRPGRVKKAGASCKGSVTDLRAKARKYGGEKGKMYHWCANMKSGKKSS